MSKTEPTGNEILEAVSTLRKEFESKSTDFEKIDNFTDSLKKPMELFNNLQPN